jgi:hypothetical protein
MENAMKSFLRNLFSTKSSAKRSSTAPRGRLSLESLEDRQLLSVTWHGGVVMPNVEVQALYYGSDWNGDYMNTAVAFEGYLNNLVHGPYLDMLTNAGYGVGRGSFDAGWITFTNPDRSQWLTDSTLRDSLTANISAGNLRAPDANRLYVIFVEDNVAVQNDHDGNKNSQKDFLGYHGAFGWNGSDIRYAVIPYHGGWMGNAQVPGLTTFNSMTEVVSHELAEAVTDPDVNYKQYIGWYDDTLNGEIGDITNQQYVVLNGYVVQRISDKNDQAMTPAAAVAQRPWSYVLDTSGRLYEYMGGGSNFIGAGIASISDQGIDNQGHAMIDAVTTTGDAYEYHADFGWVKIWGGAVSAKAGQGESFILFSDGSLWEYKDKDGSWWHLSDNVASIDAGTDRFGVNSVVEISTWGGAYEWSDSTGWHYIDYNVQSASAGRQGIVDLVYNTGNAYWWNEATTQFVFLGSNVTQVTTGFDQSGNYIIDLLYTNGNVNEWRQGGWHFKDYNVQSMAKSVAGYFHDVSRLGNAWEFDLSDNYTLMMASIASQVA